MDDTYEVARTFQPRPCYPYTRRSDRLPTYDELPETVAELRVKVKLFDPTGSGTWWIVACDPDTLTATGIQGTSRGREVGRFSMRDLAEFRGHFRFCGRDVTLPIERDLHFKPMTVMAVLEPKDEQR